MTSPCQECGFRYDLDEAPAAGPAIVLGAGHVARLLTGDPFRLRHRPAPDVWSPLEYACHLRDVLLVQRERVLLARRTEEPSLVPMGRDERVGHDGYAAQNPVAVARQLNDAAAMFAHTLSRLEGDDWRRRVVYNYPERTPRSLRWVAVHTLHEVEHHHLDVRRQLPGA